MIYIYQSAVVFPGNGLPGVLVGDSGDRQTVEPLESGYGCQCLASIDSVRDQIRMPVVVLVEGAEHLLEAAHRLPDKGFIRSHRTTSCLTGSALPFPRFLPGNWVSVVEAA